MTGLAPEVVRQSLDALGGDQLIDGPTAAERAGGRYWALAEVTDANGSVVRSVIETPTGYTYT